MDKPDKLWRLMTAIFLLAAAGGMFMLAYILSNGSFNNTVSVLALYICIGCILIGIGKGLLVILEYHRGSKSEE